MARRNQTSGSQGRSKSITYNKKSLGPAAGTFLHKLDHQQSMDQPQFSRQSIGGAQSSILLNPPQNLQQKSISHNVNMGNKENLQQSSKSAAKKKKRKSAQKEHGVAVTDKSKITRELEYLKNMMKEHFKFFDNHSPQLKKKQRTGSHSPPKK